MNSPLAVIIGKDSQIDHKGVVADGTLGARTSGE
jgi:hypothetical protein